MEFNDRHEKGFVESQLRNRPRATQPKKGKDSGTGAGRQHWSIGAWSFSARVRVLGKVPVRKPASACPAGGDAGVAETAHPLYLALYVDGTGPGGARRAFSHAFAGETTSTFRETRTRHPFDHRPGTPTPPAGRGRLPGGTRCGQQGPVGRASDRPRRSSLAFSEPLTSQRAACPRGGPSWRTGQRSGRQRSSGKSCCTCCRRRCQSHTAPRWAHARSKAPGSRA